MPFLFNQFAWHTTLLTLFLCAKSTVWKEFVSNRSKVLGSNKILNSEFDFFFFWVYNQNRCILRPFSPLFKWIFLRFPFPFKFFPLTKFKFFSSDHPHLPFHSILHDIYPFNILKERENYLIVYTWRHKTPGLVQRMPPSPPPPRPGGLTGPRRNSACLDHPGTRIVFFKPMQDEDPVLAKKPDPGLCTSNEGRFLKVVRANILDHFISLLFCFHTFGVRRPL